jgi:hypothetical protein
VDGIPLLVGSPRGRCSCCGRTFANENAFQLHWQAPWQTKPTGRCYDPASKGLVQDAEGIWRRSAPQVRRGEETADDPSAQGALIP